MFAIIRSGNKQYRVEENREIRVQRLALEPGAAFETAEVLLLEKDGDVKVGTPFVEGAKVVGKVLSQGKGRKIRVFKYKAKKNYRRRYGSREHYTAIRIEQIVTA
jgi:large subunit ribosomal protein L21